MAERFSNIFEAITGRSVKSVQQMLGDNAPLEDRDEEGRTPLMFAALLGYKEIVSEILRHRPNLEAVDEEGCTAVTLVSILGRAEILAQLLEAGASAEGPNPILAGEALSFAARQNSVDCVHLLLKAGADVNHQDESGSTALIGTAHGNSPDCARILIRAGAVTDSRDQFGRTALYCAVTKSYKDVCSVLLEAGADADLQNNDGISPRMLAAESKSATIRQLFDHK